jgi:hypothetical protein
VLTVRGQGLLLELLDHPGPSLDAGLDLTFQLPFFAQPPPEG